MRRWFGEGFRIVELAQWFTERRREAIPKKRVAIDPRRHLKLDWDGTKLKCPTAT